MAKTFKGKPETLSDSICTTHKQNTINPVSPWKKGQIMWIYSRQDEREGERATVEQATVWQQDKQEHCNRCVTPVLSQPNPKWLPVPTAFPASNAAP